MYYLSSQAYDMKITPALAEHISTTFKEHGPGLQLSEIAASLPAGSPLLPRIRELQREIGEDAVIALKDTDKGCIYGLGSAIGHMAGLLRADFQ